MCDASTTSCSLHTVSLVFLFIMAQQQDPLFICLPQHPSSPCILGSNWEKCHSVGSVIDLLFRLLSMVLTV